MQPHHGDTAAGIGAAGREEPFVGGPVDGGKQLPLHAGFPGTGDGLTAGGVERFVVYMGVGVDQSHRSRS